VLRDEHMGWVHIIHLIDWHRQSKNKIRDIKLRIELTKFDSHCLCISIPEILQCFFSRQ
jgi:hypothetical protein